MRNHTSKKKPHDNESREEEEANVQPIRHRTGEEEEEEVAEEDLEQRNNEDDAEDHTMEDLDDDDLANMQGPDA